MTRVADRKTVMRAETSARYRGAPLMVTVEAHEVMIREKGRRRGIAVPWLVVYEVGMRLAAEERRRAKGRARAGGGK
jgi:hypothetical protein